MVFKYVLFGKKGQGEALPATVSGFSDPWGLPCARGCACARSQCGGYSPGMLWEGGLPERGVGLQWEWDPQGMVQAAVSMSMHTQNVWMNREEPGRPWKLPAFHWPQERARGQLPGTLRCPFPGTTQLGLGTHLSPPPTFQRNGQYLCFVLGSSLLSPGRCVPQGLLLSLV